MGGIEKRLNKFLADLEEIGDVSQTDAVHELNKKR